MLIHHSLNTNEKDNSIKLLYQLTSNILADAIIQSSVRKCYATTGPVSCLFTTQIVQEKHHWEPGLCMQGEC